MPRYPVRFLPALAGALVAVVIGVLAVVLLSGGDDAPETARDATPAASPSPRAAAATPVVPRGCEEWPAEAATILTGGQLSLPDGLCLRLVDSAAGLPQSCAGSRGCYEASARTIWYVAAAAPSDGPSRASVLAHELCHAHQHGHVVKDGPADPDNVSTWPLTEEGEAYLALGSSLPAGFLLVPDGPVETFANVCAAWLLPDEAAPRATLVLPYPVLVNFLQTWLQR